MPSIPESSDCFIANFITVTNNCDVYQGADYKSYNSCVANYKTHTS